MRLSWSNHLLLVRNSVKHDGNMGMGRTRQPDTTGWAQRGRPVDSFCEKSHVPYLTIRDLGIAVPSLVWSFYLHYMKFTGVSYFNNEGMAAE